MSVQNESCPNCGWQFDVLVAEVPCRSCTGLGDTWHYGPLPEPNIQGFLLVEYGHPDINPLDRDRYTFAGVRTAETLVPGGSTPRLYWHQSGGWAGDEIVECETYHVVRWQWLRGEPGAPVYGSTPVMVVAVDTGCPF